MTSPISLPPKIVSVLLERLKDEFDAFYFYRSASNWCENVGYNNAAAYFKNESEQELVHAKGIEKYLTDWNVMPVLPTIDSAEQIFKSLVEVIEKSYEIEYALYEAYEKNATFMLSNDICTFGFLQPYLKIQVESVAEYSTMLNKLALINAEDKNWIYQFEKEEFGD